jgi:hypothetical protein
MLGLTKEQRREIAKVVEELFDSLAFQMIGDIPELRGKKSLFLTAEAPANTLARVFVESAGNRDLNRVEKRVLDGNLQTAMAYIEKLRGKTEADVLGRLDGYLKTQSVKGAEASEDAVREILAAEMDKARRHIKTIAEAEATKSRNVGKGLDIVKVSSSQGIEDPVVFFVVIKDNVTCGECKRLHLLSDLITPRLWKFSELNQDYHKKGNASPSISGAHPHCRCTLSTLMPGFGFENGRVTFVHSGFDALAEQRKG